MASGKADWEAIGREYRAGQLSIREIARQYEVSEGAIRKKAKHYGWTRDLSDEVRRETRARTQREELNEGVTGPDNERAAVDQAAARGVEVVRQHRELIGNTIATLREMQTLVHMWFTAGDETDENGIRVRDRIEVVLFPGKGDGISSLMQSLSSSLDRVVRLERKAFNLDEDDEGGDAEDILARLERGRERVARRGG